MIILKNSALKFLFFILTVIIYFPGNPCFPPPFTTTVSDTIHNPVYDYDFPDPTIIKATDGRYYAYATQGNANGRANNIQLSSSVDLVHWRAEGDVLPVKPTWADHDFWAPHVLYDGSLKKYVLFYSGESRDTTIGKCIGVAFAEMPTGPFIDMGQPLICGAGFQQIDPMAFYDSTTGKKWLYWGSGFEPIKVQEMDAGWQHFKTGSSATAVVYPGIENNYDRLIEGAWMDQHDGKYYLYYSGDNCCGDKANYAVMVAKADRPTGPFKRMGEETAGGKSVILEKDAQFIAPGHNSIFRDENGNTWIAYHAIWKDTTKAGTPRGPGNYTKRVMCISTLKYINGWPVISK